jgi:hypothetical protein
MTSTARTVYLPADPSQYLTELAWPQKGPNDVVDCTLDATLFLADESLSGGTDTIATVGALTLSGNITGTLTGQTPTTITWTFAGGTVTAPPTVYTIGISFTTAAGNSVSRNIYMTIVPLTLYQGNPQDIAVVQGLPGPPGQQGIPGNVSASAVVYPTHASAGNTPNDMQSLTVEQVFTNVGIEQPLTWYENNAATSTVGAGWLRQSGHQPVCGHQFSAGLRCSVQAAQHQDRRAHRSACSPRHSPVCDARWCEYPAGVHGLCRQ